MNIVKRKDHNEEQQVHALKNILDLLSLDFSISASKLNFLIAIALVAFYNPMLWHYLFDELQMFKFDGTLFVISFVMVLVALFYSCLSLLSFKKIHKPAVIAVLFLAAVSSYFMYQYDIIIDKSMMIELSEMNYSDIINSLDWSFMFHMTALWLFPSIIIMCTDVYYKKSKCRILTVCSKALFGLLFAIVILVPQYSSFSDFIARHPEIGSRIVPSNTFYYSSSYFCSVFPRAYADTKSIVLT